MEKQDAGRRLFANQESSKQPKTRNEDEAKTTPDSRAELASILVPSTDKKVEVLLWLLRENRMEIRFWQERLFFTSFWFNAAIIGIAAFALRERTSFPNKIVMAIGCICLAAFHFIICRVAKRATAHSGTDLLKIQAGLLLTEPDQFLSKESIYSKGGKWLEQGYITWFIFLNCLLCIGAIIGIALSHLQH